MLARQISARGGDIRCELKGDRVLMAGRAVTAAGENFAALNLNP